MKIAVIVNAASERLKGSGFRDELAAKLTGHELDFRETSSPGDATRIARRLLDETDIRYIAIAGGDGTLNEAAQSLVGSSKVIVPLPMGTGSDFARALGIDSTGSAAEAILSGNIINADAALCHWNGLQRYFVNILEIGFGASVMKRVNSHAIRSGKVFTRSVFRELFALRNYQVEIQSKEHSERLMSPEIIIANGIYFGGGMKASPGSKITDGKLDAHIIGKLGRISLLFRFGKLRNGTYTEDPDVKNFLSDEIRISGDAPVEMDGEVVGALPMTVKVIPSSLLFAATDKSLFLLKE